MKRILIAEDDKNVSELYREEFQSEGYDVKIVNNGYTAVELAREWQPHIVVLDIGMPEKSGLEVLSDLCGVIPVIVNTAYPLFRNDYRSLRAKAWILKSSDIEPLKKLVRKTLNESCMKKDG